MSSPPKPPPSRRRELSPSELSEKGGLVHEALAAEVKPALGDRGEDTGVTIGEFLVEIGLQVITPGSYALWYRADGGAGGSWLMVEATNEQTRSRVGLDYGLILGAGVDVEGKKILIEKCALGGEGVDLREIGKLRLAKAALVEKRADGVVSKAILSESQLVAHLRNHSWGKSPFRGEIPKH